MIGQREDAVRGHRYNPRMDARARLDAVLGWARQDDNIRAVVLTGSFARGAADRFSDLDIELYVVNPAPLLEHDAWYHQFGEALVVEALENEGWNPSRLVYYAAGKIDFTILSVSLLQGSIEFDRPFQVLVDKDGMASSFRAVALPPVLPPPESEFLRCIHHFYAAVIMWAKYVARGDPLAAKLRDWESKQLLLEMLEWDQRAKKGWEFDTWYLGLHLHDWVDPDLIPEIKACWCGVDPAASALAIRASLALFEMLSRRTAHRLGYPPFDAAGVRAEVERLLGSVGASEL